MQAKYRVIIARLENDRPTQIYQQDFAALEVSDLVTLLNKRPFGYSGDPDISLPITMSDCGSVGEVMNPPR
jgi:hypothetical protein